MPNPIRKVLSSMRAHRVRALLMGGQACVFYGAAEFSRDTDLATDTPTTTTRRRRGQGRVAQPADRARPRAQQ